LETNSPGIWKFKERAQSMKVNSKYRISILLLLIFLSPVNAFAQLFGADEEDLAKIEFELKKFNAHLENLKTVDIKSIQRQQEELLRQIKEVQQAIPQIQGAIELNKSETLGSLNKTNLKVSDLEAEVKNQVLEKIYQQNKILEQFRQDQKNLKEGLAQDIENFEKSSKSNFEDFSIVNQTTLGKVVQQVESQSATTKKGFDDTIALFREDVIPAISAENQKNRETIQKQLTHLSQETQKHLEAFSVKNQNLNQKLIEILQESLKQGVDSKTLLDTINKDLKITHVSLEGTNKNLVVADNKINKLSASLQALQAQQTTTNNAIVELKADLAHAGEFNKLADEKFNKLIALTSELAVHSTDMENSVVGQLKEAAQKEGANIAKVDLANEKLSRLIEILKAIAKEQANIGPLASTLGTMQKDQASIMKNQKEIREVLGDLRRKANVNISRNDDIKKSLEKTNPAKGGAGGK
jgi:hypothetical protein